MDPIDATRVSSDQTRSQAVPTILVVDDDPAILDMLMDILTEEGYQVLIATDGKTALDLAHRTTLVLVLTDYMMPRMNGIELSRQLRANFQTAAVPIILMSAVPPTDFVYVTTMIKKPFDIDALVVQIKRYQLPSAL